MADERLRIDENSNNVSGAVTNDGSTEIVQLRVDPTTKRLLVDAIASDPTDFAVYTDDSQYTVGVDNVGATGFLADETATDSVGEGDIGIARMTLDRKQINAGDFTDDSTEFTIGASKFGLVGGLADDTGTDSVDEGDVGAIRMSLRRAMQTNLDTLISGEDQTNNVMRVEGQFTYARMSTATTTTQKSGAGLLHSITINKGVATGTITCYDNTAGSGTIIALITFGAALLSDPPITAIYDVQFSTGLTTVTSQATDITFAYR